MTVEKLREQRDNLVKQCDVLDTRIKTLLLMKQISVASSIIVHYTSSGLKTLNLEQHEVEELREVIVKILRNRTFKGKK